MDHEIESQLQSLERSVDSHTDNVDMLLERVEDINIMIKERLHLLSTHDHEKYDTRLQQVREHIWRLKKPKRFQFKSRKHTQANQKPSTSLGSGAASRDSIEGSPIAQTSAVLFEPDEKSSLNLSNLENSVVIAYNITGALHVTNVRHSTIIAKCAQCRIHDSTDVDVQLERCKSPVIEGSDCIRFHLSVPEAVNVSDFSWMRTDPSPHFTVHRTQTETSKKAVSSYTREDAEELSRSMRT